MLEELSSTEIDVQHLELLPARTVMSMFMTGTEGSGDAPTTGGTAGESKDPLASFTAILKDFPIVGKALAGK